MCFICVSLEKDKIKPSQVKEFLEEFEEFIDDEHYAEVAANLIGPQKKKRNKGLKMPGPQGWAMVDDDDDDDLFHWSHNLDWGRD